MLRRRAGQADVGIVTTADVTDATPAANASHTPNDLPAQRSRAQYLDERESQRRSACSLAGAPGIFQPEGGGGSAPTSASWHRGVHRRRGTAGVDGRPRSDPVRRHNRCRPGMLGLFHPAHLTGGVRQGRGGEIQRRIGAYRERSVSRTADARRPGPAAISLATNSPGGVLPDDRRRVDRRAGARGRCGTHDLGHDRVRSTPWPWRSSSRDERIATRIRRMIRWSIVTADHETGGLWPDRRREPSATRLRRSAAASGTMPPSSGSDPVSIMNFFPDYSTDAKGYPEDPDPSRKLLLGWAAASDRYENWISNRLQRETSSVNPGPPPTRSPTRRGTVTCRPATTSRSIGKHVPSFLVPGVIENGATGCPEDVRFPSSYRVRSPTRLRGILRPTCLSRRVGPGASAVSWSLRKHRRVSEDVRGHSLEIIPLLAGASRPL